MIRIEHQANLLWIPADSDYNTREDWLDSNFKSKSRDEIILFSNENVLTPDSIKEVKDVLYFITETLHGFRGFRCLNCMRK